MFNSSKISRCILALVAIILSSIASAQEPVDSVFYNELEEVIISSNKFAEKRKNISQKVEVVTARQIREINAQNSGDLLMNTGNVFVQKSQQGGSSPVIRGFEASRVLLVIDGVRMNNAIYRSGHLQNVITVDQNMLERVEVLYGPASTMYGSDALGGVVNFRTRTPRFSSGKPVFKPSAFTRFSSANNERTVHADLETGLRKFAFLTSLTASDFGDMRMGDNYPDKYPDFGRRTFYVERINDKDSVIPNRDDRIQRFSGYSQWDLLQKIVFKPTDQVTHSLNLQLSGSSDIPRYDRLTDTRGGKPRYAEWYYGPQRRILAAYEFNASLKKGFFTEYKAAVNFQSINESRHQRVFEQTGLDNRMERVNVLGIAADARKKWNLHELNVGFDGQLNDVQSTAYRKDIVSGTRTPVDTRYPDGKNKMNYYGIYAQHLYKLIPDKLILNDGIRLQAVELNSTIEDTSKQLNLPFRKISQQNLAVTGNLGLIFLPDNHTKLALSIASGFRAPNIDDLSKIFESSTEGRQLIVPNPDVQPEYTYSADLSLTRTFDFRHTVSLNLYHTWFRNAIVVAPFRFQGKDSILYNGVMSAVLANQNRNQAWLYGASLQVNSNISPSLQLNGTVNYTYGRYKTPQDVQSNVYRRQQDGSYARVLAYVDEKPLDHIPPIYGKISVKYRRGKFQSEFYSLFNGWKRIRDYNADGEDNAQYATHEGMPTWYTLNLKGSYGISSQLVLRAGLENILDRNYRQFGSGFSAAGRNLVASLHWQL